MCEREKNTTVNCVEPFYTIHSSVFFLSHTLAHPSHTHTHTQHQQQQQAAERERESDRELVSQRDRKRRERELAETHRAERLRDLIGNWDVLFLLF